MSEELRRQRATAFFAAAEEGYNRYSRIQYATVPRIFNSITDSELTFSQIGVAQEFEDDWYTNRGINSDMVFYDIGRAVAIGEDNYLLKKIQTVLNKSSLEIEVPREKNFESRIQQMRDALIDRGYMPNVLFAPIKFMTPMMLGVPTFRVKEGRDYMLTPSGYLEIFWSNNYTPFDDFFIVNKKQFGEWVFKSDSGDRLLTEFTRIDSKKHKVVARTVVSYKILREEAGIRVKVSE
jgi:hypothetical protein